MKRLLKYILLLPLVFVVSCTEYDKKGWQMTEDELTDTSIINFTVVVTDGDTDYKLEAEVEEDQILVKFPVLLSKSAIEKATADVTLSNMATIYPWPSTQLDYTADGMIFTVTAADGVTTKDYTYHWEDGEGFALAHELWKKTWDELGLTGDQNSNSAAVCGDYLVLARTHKIYDRWTGEDTGLMLNVTGVPNSHVFWLTNDDEGNMVGCTLAQIAPNGEYNIYKWTDPLSDPILVIESTVDAGRRIDVRGNINGAAYISSWIRDTGYYENEHADSMAQFHRFKLDNGVVSELGIVHSNRRRHKNLNTWPSFTLQEPADETTYYVFSQQGYESAPSISYGTTPIPTSGFMVGPLNKDEVGDTAFGFNGWGNTQRQFCGVFPFNGVNYLLMTNAYGEYGSYLAVLDTKEVRDWWGIRSLCSYWVPQALEHTNNNGNNTASITMVVEEGGAEAHLYLLATGSGIACHRFVVRQDGDEEPGGGDNNDDE